MVNNFRFSKIPDIHFGPGVIDRLPILAKSFGSKFLLIKGKASLDESEYYKKLKGDFMDQPVQLYEVSLSIEPSPDFVDQIVQKYKSTGIDLVISIGGGSVIDCGKAISAMLPQEGSVRNYLEGMETKVHNGVKIPFIAVPTSSGTGAEATKNAVLSEVGVNGFKRSLRHDNFVPDIALVDPYLTLTCPPNITASCGLDALTQLIEAYVSTNASHYTDALAVSGIEQFASGFTTAYTNGLVSLPSRICLSYASLTSGIVLANAGLGAVHGIAGVIGGLFDIPHGVVCGTLLGSVTKSNIEVLMMDKGKNEIFLTKYAKIGNILSGKSFSTIEASCNGLIHTLNSLITYTEIPRLSKYGITVTDITKIAEAASNKNNPVVLSEQDFKNILLDRI